MTFEKRLGVLLERYDDDESVAADDIRGLIVSIKELLAELDSRLAVNLGLADYVKKLEAENIQVKALWNEAEEEVAFLIGGLKK